LDFASHKLECADLRKSFSVCKAVRSMRYVRYRTGATDRMKLRSDADEWKSDTFFDAMCASEMGRAATDILVERACLHLPGRLRRFSCTARWSALPRTPCTWTGWLAWKERELRDFALCQPHQ
jgi:hypothetical protein